MKAILMSVPGGPEVLQLQEVPDPQIRGERELRIRLKAAGVNPIDTKLRRRGTFYPEEMPAILGCDGAGIVEAVGSGVRQFRVGDEVYFCHGGLGKQAGNYAQLIVVDERFVAAKPKSLSFAEAAAAPLVLITAWEALYDRGRLQADQTVLIHGGAGGVGHVAIQLAHLRGSQVATTVSTPEKVEFVRSLGASLPILYRQVDFLRTVLDWTGGEGVDLALDTLGGAMLEKTFPAVRIYGDMVTLLAPAPETDWRVARDRNLRLSLELMLTPMLNNLIHAQQNQAEILRQCARLIDQGQLRIQLSHTFPLAEAAAAHQLLEQGSALGKIALAIPD